MKRLVNISFTSSASNFEADVKLEGESIHVSHFGCDFDIDVMRSLIAEFDGKADVIGLQGIQHGTRIGSRRMIHPESQALLDSVRHSIVVTGDLLRSAYLPWAVRELIRKDPAFFRKKRIGFYSGALEMGLAQMLSEQTERMVFLDPYLHVGAKTEIRSLPGLESYLRRVTPFARFIPLGRHIRPRHTRKSLLGIGLGDFEKCDIFVTRMTLLERFRFDHLKGKTLLVDYVTPGVLKGLHEAGVQRVVSFAPRLPMEGDQERFSFGIIEGLLQCLKPEREPLREDDILEFVDRFGLKPQIAIDGAAKPQARRFAFVIHPLSYRQLFRIPFLKPFKGMAENFGSEIETAMGKIPPGFYGKITGVRSEATGQEVEGDFFIVYQTPRVMMKEAPEKMYDVLTKVCVKASERGADIIGLGAYTKIVGDGGITVAKRSPIPLTTGNSLSASATLWAARDACAKLGFLPSFKLGSKVRGKAMIIGATGSIGGACAKVLAYVFEELVLVGRRADKLLEIRSEIQELVPRCKVTLVTSPNAAARSCDLIVTSTSSYDKKVLDIMAVKPGCVICDVSRPLDVSEEDAVKRPDVLVVESGEIELPGDVKLDCDIGTPDDAVYACLAETALLALDGRFESFTLSKNINHRKVIEIYDIAKKHGAKLAAIRGHNGLITDQEIALCREHALKALETWKATED